MTSQIVKTTLDFIQADAIRGTPLRTLNALGCHPLLYRTFGGQPRANRSLDRDVLERAFGSNYLLTMLASGAILRKLLYPEPESVHCLYCDGWTCQFLDSHGIVEHGVWDMVDHEVLDSRITMENVDHRIYYSAVKPYALSDAARRSRMDGLPVLFVDADLIMKKRHDYILKRPETIRAAYGHLEAIRMPCYCDFTRLHFPEGFLLPAGMQTDLPAVNTCLMYFNDLDLLEEWSRFFASLFEENWLPKEPDSDTISQQLLGFDQRTFPMVAASHGLWGTEVLEAFLDITWDPPCFYDNVTGEKAEWHYYTLEHHPEHLSWRQEITHTWINKRNIERDIPYRNYQGCIMLEIVLELEPGIEPYLRSFKSLEPYFALRRNFKTIEEMLSMGAVHDRLDKSC